MAALRASDAQHTWRGINSISSFPKPAIIVRVPFNPWPCTRAVTVTVTWRPCLRLPDEGLSATSEEPLSVLENPTQVSVFLVPLVNWNVTLP